MARKFSENSKTLEFLCGFETYNGPSMKDGEKIRGDIATFDPTKAEAILSLKQRAGNLPVARVLTEAELRPFYEREKRRLAADAGKLFLGPAIKEVAKPNLFRRYHAEAFAKFEAEAPRKQA